MSSGSGGREDGGRSDPKVSIIVPVYNAERHLDASISSILAQTYRRIEVILVDDGSRDGSGALCDAFAERDERVVVVHRENGGIAAAQNTGLDRATGELITFCDNDDLMSPHLVRRLVGILVESDSDMSCCRWWSIGESTAEAALRVHSQDPPGRTITFEDPGHAYQSVFSLLLRKLGRRELRYFSEANWGKLYRASLFDGIRFPEGRFAQDVAIAMDLYMRMSRVASCSDALYFWVQHPSSVSHRVEETSYFHDIVRAHGRSFDLALAAGITPARAYGGLMTTSLERESVRTGEDADLYRTDVEFVRARVLQLTLAQRAKCRLLHWIRRREVQLYRMTVHRRR